MVVEALVVGVQAPFHERTPQTRAAEPALEEKHFAVGMEQAIQAGNGEVLGRRHGVFVLQGQGGFPQAFDRQAAPLVRVGIHQDFHGGQMVRIPVQERGGIFRAGVVPVQDGIGPRQGLLLPLGVRGGFLDEVDQVHRVSLPVGNLPARSHIRSSRLHSRDSAARLPPAGSYRSGGPCGVRDGLDEFPFRKGAGALRQNG